MGDFPARLSLSSDREAENGTIEFTPKTGHQEKIMGDMGIVNFGMQIPIKIIGEYPVVSPCLGLQTPHSSWEECSGCRV
jgi:hypothetical protein